MAGPRVNDPLTSVYLREAVNYDPVTGLFVWKVRPREHFATDQSWGCWNTKHSGKPTGSMGSKGYVILCVNGRLYKAHRLAWLYMTGEWPSDQIDHRNGNRSENFWHNLREATNAQNVANSRQNRNRSSGLKGAYLDNRDGSWMARITVDRKIISLGSYKTPEEAHEAYKKAATKYFGEFARFA